MEKYRPDRPIVLAIPRGGVEVGFEVARRLEADFDVLIARKLPLPGNPEAGFGAVAEGGSIYIMDTARWSIPDDVIDRIVAEQEREVERRIEVLRNGRPLPDLSGRTVLLVDDGLAMGSTMRVSVVACRNARAGTVVVGVPVAGGKVAKEFEKLADDVIVLDTPPNFRAVAESYRMWYDVSDREAIELLGRKPSEPSS